MKTKLLVRSLIATALFTLGFVGIAERFDPVLDHQTITLSDAQIEVCTAPCEITPHQPVVS